MVWDQFCLTVPLPSSDSLLIVTARANVKPMSRAVPLPRRRMQRMQWIRGHSKGSLRSLAIRGVRKRLTSKSVTDFSLFKIQKTFICNCRFEASTVFWYTLLLSPISRLTPGCWLASYGWGIVRRLPITNLFLTPGTNRKAPTKANARHQNSALLRSAVSVSHSSLMCW